MTMHNLPQAIRVSLKKIVLLSRRLNMQLLSQSLRVVGFDKGGSQPQPLITNINSTLSSLEQRSSINLVRTHFQLSYAIHNEDGHLRANIKQALGSFKDGEMEMEIPVPECQVNNECSDSPTHIGNKLIDVGELVWIDDLKKVMIKIKTSQSDQAQLLSKDHYNKEVASDLKEVVEEVLLVEIPVMDPNSSVGKTCLGENVIEISSDKAEGHGDWNSPEYHDTTNSGGKKETKAMVFHKMDTEEIIDRFGAPYFVKGLEAYDREINLGIEENMISNEFVVKLCLDREVKCGNKVVKKELIVALRGEIYFVKFIINPEDDDVEPGVVFGRSFMRLTKKIDDFRTGTVIIYLELDPIFVARNVEFFENSLALQETIASHGLLKASGSDVGLELIQEDDTQPSENTSERHDEVEPTEVEPHSVEVPSRRSRKISQAPDRYGFYVDDEEHELGDLNEPPNYKAALSDPKSEKWLDAMNTEMQSMKDNQVWCLIDLPPNGRIVGSKWLFKKRLTWIAMYAPLKLIL
ncbi:zinc finger BED domain-containing protein RICESLEEPER 2 [Tanacetum coccineum]